MTDRPLGRVRERRRAPLGAAFGATLLMVGACAPGPTAPPSTPSTSPVPSLGPTATARPTATAAGTRAYFVLGSGARTGLVPVASAIGAPEDGPESATRALLAGPPVVEGLPLPALRTAIPRGVEWLGLNVDAGVATVDLDATFETATDDGLPTAFRVAQVVYTLTQFPEIDAVQIHIAGELVTRIGPDGFPQDRPLVRADFTEQLPALFVDVPAWGSAISSPVHVVGLANAFEATFELRIADAEGRALAAGSVTASCGTGCWGDFDVVVPFTVQAAGPGVLQVFELSPRDGATQNLREYVVTLEP